VGGTYIRFIPDVKKKIINGFFALRDEVRQPESGMTEKNG